MEKNDSLSERLNLGLNSGDLAGRMRRREIVPAAPVNRSPRYITEVRNKQMAVMPALPSQPRAEVAAAPVVAPTPPVAAQPAEGVQYAQPQTPIIKMTPVVHPVPQTEVLKTEAPVLIEAPLPINTEMAPQESTKTRSLPKLNLFRLRKYVVEGAVVGVLLFMGVGVYSVYTHTPGKAKTVEATVETKMAYDVYVPSTDKFHVQEETLDYNTRTDMYSYVISRKDGLKVYVNQKSDSQDAKKEYIGLVTDRIDRLITKNGTIDVANPEKLKGGQAALGNINGTLFFARTDKQMLEADWLELLNNLRKKAD